MKLTAWILIIKEHFHEINWFLIIQVQFHEIAVTGSCTVTSIHEIFHLQFASPINDICVFFSELGICSFALSLICSLLFRSKSLIIKNDCERFALVAL